jgi:hypothetical protein
MPSTRRSKVKDPDAVIREFRARLEAGEYRAFLRRARGTLRFDLVEGDTTQRFLVELDGGEVTVSERRGTPDATVVVGKDLFAGMLEGTVNAMAAALRGTLQVEGDLGLVVLFQRVFPGPPARLAKPSRPARKGAKR